MDYRLHTPLRVGINPYILSPKTARVAVIRLVLPAGRSVIPSPSSLFNFSYYFFKILRASIFMLL